MKEYIVKPYGFFKHSVKVTFQKGPYKGDLIRKAGGNVIGRAIMIAASDFDMWDSNDIKYLEENNCQLTIYDEHNQNWFGIVLKDIKGNKLVIEDTLDQLEKMIIAVEIVNWAEDN
jgi:hypothetical protein